MSDIYKKYYDEWIESCGEEEPNYDASYEAGWNQCKSAVLEILKGDSRDFENKVRKL